MKFSHGRPDLFEKRITRHRHFSFVSGITAVTFPQKSALITIFRF